jgi:ABC-type multidrug transport system ATPase subunit
MALKGGVESEDSMFTSFQKKEETMKLQWKDVVYSVGGSGKKRKEILHGISGEASPGDVTAIMGPSGSGKTT